jgi:rSAM/selenodomain-associated transferase 2
VTALQALRALREDGCEVIVADGGSDDGTPVLALPLCDRVIAAPRGRATQMNAGALASTAEVLVFLHADTRLPAGAAAAVRAALRQGAEWGRFDVRLEGAHPMLRVIERMINLRSRLTGVATGDQAIFVTREAFRKVGGFPAIPLMEDVAISKLLRRHTPPACLRLKVATSARRWESRGVWRTMFLMWRLRLAYFLGASPEALARRYR